MIKTIPKRLQHEEKGLYGARRYLIAEQLGVNAIVRPDWNTHPVVLLHRGVDVP